MIQYTLYIVLLVSVTCRAQNVTEFCTSAANRNSCVKCMSHGNVCFYCSTLGCRPSTVNDYNECIATENSTLVDHINKCPDPCYDLAMDSCNDCMSPKCGFCWSVSRCMTGSFYGPAYQSCGTWRFQAINSNLTVTQTCSFYEICANLTDCASCVATAQNAYTPCSWTANMTCIAGLDGGALTCPMDSIPIASDPAPQTSSARQSSMNAGSIAFLIGFAIVSSLP